MFLECDIRLGICCDSNIYRFLLVESVSQHKRKQSILTLKRTPNQGGDSLSITSSGNEQQWSKMNISTELATPVAVQALVSFIANFHCKFIWCKSKSFIQIRSTSVLLSITFNFVICNDIKVLKFVVACTTICEINGIFRGSVSLSILEQYLIIRLFFDLKRSTTNELTVVHQNFYVIINISESEQTEYYLV